jgi:hypothetical protein
MNFFSVAFDRRKYKRIKTNLIGVYSLEQSLSDNLINIIDLCRGGLSFIQTDKNMIEIGDRLTISFNLDNADKDRIECRVLVRNIVDKRVCCEFIDMRDGMKTKVGFYMM